MMKHLVKFDFRILSMTQIENCILVLLFSLWILPGISSNHFRKYKKKQNPIYEAAETTLKEKDYNEKHWKRVRRHTRMAVILFIFLFVIAIAALIISIFGGIIQVSGSGKLINFV